MALNYGDNYVHIIKKNGVNYNVKDAIAADAIDIIQGDVNTEGSILHAAEGAKSYSKGLIDKVLGADSAAQTITNLQNVLNELNDPDNAQGIPGTFVDTVKTGLAGLGNKTEAVYYTQKEINAAQEGDPAYGKTTSDIKTPAVLNTVKDYVDAAVQNASSDASGAIAALDAEETSSDGTNVQVKVTEVDGKITAVSVTDNSINATDLSNKVGNLGNATEAQAAVYYTQEEADAYNTEHSLNPEDAGYVTTATVKTPATEAVAHTVKSYVDTKFSDSAFTITNHILELGL